MESKKKVRKFKSHGKKGGKLLSDDTLESRQLTSEKYKTANAATNLYSSDDSDAEVDAFTKLFMERGSSGGKRSQRQIEGSDRDSSESEQDDDYIRARNRMSPTEESDSEFSYNKPDRYNTVSGSIVGSSQTREKQNHAAKKVGQISGKETMESDDDDDDDDDDHTDDSNEDDEDLIRARNRMSPSEESESEGSESDTGRSESSLADDHRDKTVEEEEGDEGTSSGEMSSDEEQNTSEPNLAALRREMADIPFEELQKLKQKIGVKAFNLAMHGAKLGKGGSFKRANKNRPMEMSSKKPVSRHREIVSVKKRVVRDPRFDDMSGKYYDHFFKNAYSFLSDIKQREKQTLLKKLKKEKDEEKKTQIQYLINRMNQQETAEKMKERQQNQRKAIKKKENEFVQQGKTPFYLKKGEQKKLELAEKFRELKKSGKLEKYLSKKRKKNAKKEKRMLPGTRTVFT